MSDRTEEETQDLKSAQYEWALRLEEKAKELKESQKFKKFVKKESESRFWYEMASSLNHPEALVKMGALYWYGGLIADQNQLRTKTIDCFTRACKHGSESAKNWYEIQKNLSKEDRKMKSAKQITLTLTEEEVNAFYYDIHGYHLTTSSDSEEDFSSDDDSNFEKLD